ncbi:MAG TPA: TonB-dependent receptor, partial [Pseudoxanthomonas sp.]|nr:TonB-dependent receptor [Pseudoxanthomonas sp.]
MQAYRSPRKNLLCAGLLIALAAPAMAQERGAADTKTLDKVNVTGSRIKRTDVEAALPVTIIQKAEIEKQGITSAEQLMMHLNVAGNSSDNLASTTGIAGVGEFRGS